MVLCGLAYLQRVPVHGHRLFVKSSYSVLITDVCISVVLIVHDITGIVMFEMNPGPRGHIFVIM